MNTNLTSRIILFNKKKEILILKDKGSNYWGLPGGSCKDGESPMQGLKRELQEEISFNFSLQSKLVGVEYRKDKIRSEIIFVFYGGILSDKNISKIKPDNEIGEARFVKIPQAYKLLTKTMTRRLQLILPSIEKNVVYIENGNKINLKLANH